MAHRRSIHGVRIPTASGWLDRFALPLAFLLLLGVAMVLSLVIPSV
jgi:hypothetical protein